MCQQKSVQVQTDIQNVFVEKETFGFSVSCLEDNEDFLCVCGVSKTTFNILTELLETVPNGKKMSRQDKIMLMLIKFKHNLPFVFLGKLFNINRKTVGQIFSSTLHAMYTAVKPFMSWISKEKVLATMPSDFKSKYPRCRVIIDATEVKCERPSTLEPEVLFYSNYKNSFTIKFLIGIAPCGLITFLSNAYGGRVTDSHITNDCGILSLLESGDIVLADKGFPQIREDVQNQGAFIVMPPFKTGNVQFSDKENAESYKCASVRIHVERAIARMKLFRVLKFVDHSLYEHIDKIILCIGFLCNQSSELISDKHDNENK